MLTNKNQYLLNCEFGSIDKMCYIFVLICIPFASASLQKVPEKFHSGNVENVSSPWLVTLSYNLLCNKIRRCSGVLISNNFVLTSNNCVTLARDVEVTLPIDPTFKLIANNFRYFGNYSLGVALIQLDKPATGKGVQSILLDEEPLTPESVLYLDDGSNNKPKLKVLSEEEYRPFGLKPGPEGYASFISGIDGCSDREGAPLVREVGGASKVAGVVMGGIQAECEHCYPFSFHKVEGYLDWIKSNSET